MAGYDINKAISLVGKRNPGFFGPGFKSSSKSRAPVSGRSGSSLVAVHIQGLSETLNAIADFEPEVYKELRKSIRGRLNTVARRAKGNRPAGTYKVTLSKSRRDPGASITALAGPRTLSVEDYVAKKKLTGWSPGLRSVIGEFAGSRSSGKTPQAQAFIRKMDTYGKPGRFLWAAYDAEGGDAIPRAIEQDIREAERILQANLDAAG